MGKLTLLNKKLLSKFWSKVGKAQEISKGFKVLKNPGFFAFLQSALNSWPANPKAKGIFFIDKEREFQQYTKQFQLIHSA